MRAAYLILYNVIQILGWTALAFKISMHWFATKDHIGTYEEAKYLLNIFQTLAVLEIIHAMVGWVRSSAVLTGFQVFSRVFLVWGIAHSVPDIHNTIGIPLFLGAWSLTEVIRYTYYVCAQLDHIPYTLQWLRYTLFIVLYPIGVTGELLTIYAALPYVKASGLYSFGLPNPGNVAFSYHVYLIFTMFMYIPIFPQLYGHMIVQRKKILGTVKSKKE